jgi:predicted RNA-binding protein with PIN domain
MGFNNEMGEVRTVKEEILIVDGYNMIGAWSELIALSAQSLELARDRLIAVLTEYQGFSGARVMVVFDAHQVPGQGGNFKQNKLEIVYTKEKETADSCIERLVTQLASRKREITVATNDNAEQHVIFGKGALRLTARELLLQVEESRKSIQTTIKQSGDTNRQTRNTFDSKMSADLKKIFEFWRRGGKE